MAGNFSNVTPATPPVRPMRSLGQVVEKPKNMKGTLRRLWELTRGHRQGLPIIFLLAALAAGSAMLSPYLIGLVVDRVSQGSAVAGVLLLLLLVYVGEGAIRLLQDVLMARVSQRIVCYIRKALFAVFNRLPLSFFDKRQHGDLMSRLTNDIDNISITISDSLAQLMLLICTLVGVLVIMLCLNLWLTLAALITAPLVFLLAKVVTSHTRVLFKNQQAQLGLLNGNIEENVSGQMGVKAFCREEEMIEQFNEVNQAVCKVGTPALIWSGFLMPLMNVINNLCFISVSVTGGIMASMHLITVGVISSFVLYARQFTRPLNDIANIYNTLQTAVAGAERIFEIFDETPEPPDKKDALPLKAPKGEIGFENTVFGYDPKKPVLKGITLHIPAGARVAIVGETGAGKTTIISLLARFYDVTQGKILLDGVDLRDYRLADLRRCFGVVLQDTALFNLSVADNIRYGKEDATLQQVQQAARAANADGFIQRLPDGYDTIIGEGGGTLSQGERQLITIARAILADAPILILDEATSSVDTRTERKVRDAVETLTKGRTSILIAHRLSTIRHCDLIVVLDGGQIAEMGNHETLLAAGGRYCSMYRAQMGLEPGEEDEKITSPEVRK